MFYSDDQYTTAITPEPGKIYVDVTAGGNSASYRWDANGNQYVQMSAQDTYANVAFKGIGASTASTIAATQVSDTIQFTSGAGIDLSRVGNNKEVKIDVAFGNDNHDRSVTLDANGKATATSLATPSPDVPGSGTTTALSFIDTVSQDSKGKITATKKNVNVDSTYSASGTNPVNGTAVSKALETLDVNDISGFGTGKTLTALSETDGKISASFGDISITKSQVSDFGHSHGNITDGGALQTTDITIGNHDKLVVTDNSNNGKVARTSVEFDGSTGTQCLTKKGDWASFAPGSHSHGNITDGGAIGSTAGYAVYTGTNGVLTAGSLARTDPSVDGNTTSFIDTVVQDEKGQITATKKTVSTMGPASQGAAGSAGLVPAPGVGKQTSFLRGDGTWQTPTDNKVTQTLLASITDAEYPVILKNDTTATDSPTNTVNYAAGITVNPKNKSVKATTFVGALSGNASSATTATDYDTNSGTIKTALGNKEDVGNKVTSWTSTTTDTHYPSEKLVKDSLDNKENASNKVTSWTSTTTDTHYPSEKLVKDSLDNKQDKLPAYSSASSKSLTVRNDGTGLYWAYKTLVNQLEQQQGSQPIVTPVTSVNASLIDGQIQFDGNIVGYFVKTPNAASDPGKVLTVSDEAKPVWANPGTGTQIPPFDTGDALKVLALNSAGTAPVWSGDYKRRGNGSYDQPFTTSQQIIKSGTAISYLYIENDHRRICIGINTNGKVVLQEEGTSEGASGKDYAPTNRTQIISSNGEGDNTTYEFNGLATSATKDSSGKTISSYYKSKNGDNDFTSTQTIERNGTDATSLNIKNNNRYVKLGIINGSGDWGLLEMTGKSLSPSSNAVVIESNSSGNNTVYKFHGTSDDSDKWHGYELVMGILPTPGTNQIAFV